jgi:hypothetical protein
MTLDNDSDNGNNIINLALWKPTKQAPTLSSTWVATDPLEEVGMSEAEMLETWGLTEEELGDLTYWGIEFRKSVLLQHSTDMRQRLTEHQDQLPMTALGEQLAIAVGALLISRASVKEIGELVEGLRKSDATIAALFQPVISIHQEALAQL